MSSLARCCCAIFAITISQPGEASPRASALPIPTFRRGMWATTVIEQVANGPAKDYPTKFTESCYDPSESIRNSLLSAENDGCSVKLTTRTGRITSYSTTCTVFPGKTEDGAFVVESNSPEDFTMTTSSKHSHRVTTGRWVRDCPAASSLPVPSLRKGVWAITSEKLRKGYSNTTSHTVMALCDCADTVIREVLLAAEKEDGCAVSLLKQSLYGASYAGRCPHSDSHIKTDWGLVIDSTKTDEFRMTEFRAAVTKVTTGRWLHDCSPAPAVELGGHRRE